MADKMQGLYIINENYGDGANYPVGYKFLFGGNTYTNEDEEEYLVGLDAKTGSIWHFKEEEITKV